MPNSASHQWKNFDCELCKYPYPYTLKINKKRVELLDIPVPEKGNYIKLEALSEKRHNIGVHII